MTVWASDFYLYRIARKYEAAGKPQKALTIYSELAEKMRSEQKDTYRIEESLLRVADTYLANRNIDGALAIYKQIQKTFPASKFLPKVADQMYLVAREYESKKDYDKTIPLYLDYLAAFSGDARAEQMKFNLAQIYYGRNRITDAERFYLNLSMNGPEPLKSIAERRLVKVQRILSSK